LRLAYFSAFAAVAGSFGGLIAFGIQHVHAPIANWRLLFIIEGIPSLLLGIITITFLPNRPESTTFFNESERVIALERMNRGTSGDVGAVVNKEHIRAGAKDYRVYLGGVIYFGMNNSFASTSAFLPTIIASFGFTNVLAQLLTVPPYAVAAVVMCTAAFFSDRLQNRGLVMAASSTLGGLGYLILLVVHSNVHARYFAVFCITSGTYTTNGLIIAWFAHNLGSETKRATGIPLFGAIGQCGALLGSHLFPSTEGPKYIKGFAVSCALELLAAVVSAFLSWSYASENRSRDRLYGFTRPDARVDTSVLADKAPDFRYVP